MSPISANVTGVERRVRVRKQKLFYIAYTLDESTFSPAYGLDVSRSGMRILTDQRMPEDDFRVRTLIEGREFLVGVRKVWDEETEYRGALWWRAGVRFVVIGTNDREFIDCYVADKEYFEGNKLLEALEQVRLRPDDADRLLPQSLLERFHRNLIRRHRLNHLHERENPLVKYQYDGPRRLQGKRIHVMTVESKFIIEDETRLYKTRFAFNDNASWVKALD